MKHIYKLSSILAITTVISTSAYAAAGGLASGNWVNKYFVDFDNDFPTPATGTASGKPTLVEAVTAKRYPTGHAKEGQGYVERKSVTAGKALKTDANGNLDVQIDGTTIKYDSTNDRLYADVSFADKDDGISANTSGVVNRFATSSTAAATTAKTANITAGTFTLEKGARVTVQFTYAHTGSTVPTLNINGTGAKAIYYNGAQLTNDNAKKLIKGVVDFVYDGTRWNLLGYHENDTNTQDGNTTYTHVANSPIVVTQPASGSTQGTIDVKYDGTTIKKNSNNQLYAVIPTQTDYTHTGAEGIEIDASRNVRVDVPKTVSGSTTTYTGGLDFSGTGNSALLKVKPNAAKAIVVENAGVGVNSGNGLQVSSNKLVVKPSTAIDVSSNGVAVKYDNSTIKVNGSGQLYAVGDGNTTDIEGGIATSVTDTNADGQKEVNVLYDTDLTVSSNKLTHANSITAGTAGSTSNTSGASVTIPYVTYDNHGHITASGTRTHTVSVTDKDDGVTAASGVTNRYAVSSTAAGTATKVASITAGTFNLESGARVTVKFNSINTASNPQLNINGTGAKPIYYRGAAITSGDNKYWIGGVLDFVYDGSTAYHLVDVNTRYVAATNAPLTFVQPTAASLTGTIDVKIDGTTITKNANNQLQAAGDGNQELRCPDGWVNMANKCMFVLGDTNNQNLASTVLTEFDASAINVNPTSTLPSVPTAPSGNTYADGNS